MRSHEYPSALSEATVLYTRAQELLKENPTNHALFNEAIKLAADGRWWDVWHVAKIPFHTNEILAGEREHGVLQTTSDEEFEAYRQILIPATILHDIGWSQVGEEKNTTWGGADLRRKHMELGAELAKDILGRVGYPHELHQPIADLIAVHDMHYLGVEPDSLLLKLHVDADGSFVFSAPSFWKDYSVQADGRTPIEFLAFQKDRYGTRHTQTAQTIVERQIAQRTNEIQTSGKTPEMWVKQFQQGAKEFAALAA